MAQPVKSLVICVHTEVWVSTNWWDDATKNILLYVLGHSACKVICSNMKLLKEKQLWALLNAIQQNSDVSKKEKNLGTKKWEVKVWY